MTRLNNTITNFVNSVPDTNSGLIHKTDTFVPQPKIVGSPRLFLSHDFVCTHYRLGTQQAQKAELRESAEKQAPHTTYGFEPVSSTPVMDLPFVGEGDPDVDVREKK